MYSFLFKVSLASHTRLAPAVPVYGTGRHHRDTARY
jgi:hypothetical protein